jgi:DNA-binding NarL/FixJ family response regulator
MLDLDSFSEAVALIYDASMDVDRWPEALGYLCVLFNSQKSQISFATSAFDSQAFFKFHGFTDAELQKTLPRYRELTPHDPRTTAIRFKAVHCRQLVSAELLHNTAMYKEVLAPVDVEYSMWFIVDLDEHSGCAMSLMRGRASEPFSEQDCAAFSRFVPHIQRATTMHGTFHRLRQQAAAAREVIDHVPLGIVVVDDDEVVLANQSARALLDEGTMLNLHSGRLRAAGAGADANLTAAIREARNGTARPVGLTLPIGGTNEAKVLIRPLNRASADLLDVGPTAIALYVRDPRQPVETPEETLQQLFGLTAREAAVLHALVQGDNLQAIAKRLGVELPTVKTHMQGIMRATSVRRQPELVQMVLTSPAWISSHSGRTAMKNK